MVGVRVILKCGSCGENVKIYDGGNGKVPDSDRIGNCLGCGAKFGWHDVEDKIKEQWAVWQKERLKVPIHVLVRVAPWEGDKDEKANSDR